MTLGQTHHQQTALGRTDLTDDTRQKTKVLILSEARPAARKPASHQANTHEEARRLTGKEPLKHRDLFSGYGIPQLLR